MNNGLGPTNVRGFLVQKWIQCGQLILTKISKIGASIYQTFSLKCTAFDFHWGSASDCSGELIALTRPAGCCI